MPNIAEKHHVECPRYDPDPPGYRWDMHCSCLWISRIEGALRERIVAALNAEATSLRATGEPDYLRAALTLEVAARIAERT